MKKNNFLILGSILLLTACSENRHPQTLISKWDKLNGPVDHIIERKLANTSLGEGQCLKDVYSIDILKEEIKSLEKNFENGKRVTGYWKHIDLSKLPIPQANFLKSFGNKLGDQSDPEAFDFRGCEDVPCLYNTIYGKGDHLAGYVHYLWYLKFGSMLSADNTIPYIKADLTGHGDSRPGIYNNRLISFDKYLYDEKELYGFWRLTHMLEMPYTSLHKLKEVQRVPRGENFEGYSSGVCGLAGSVGWINLADGCLRFNQHNLDQGYFYSSVVHEMSHQVDFHLGNSRTLFYRSHEPDYLRFTGMELLEYTDTQNKLVREWKAIDKNNFKTVTSYAQTNPQENFAESLAYFRTDGDMAKGKMTDEHYRFVGTNFFENTYYDKVSLLERMITKYSSDTNKAVFKIVVDCSEVESHPKSLYFSASDFSKPLMPVMLSCISENAREIASLLKAQIAVREAEGCSSLNEFPGKSKWDELVKRHLVGVFNRYLDELSKDENYIARIKVFYDRLSDKTIAQDAYVSCYGEMGMRLCYERELKRLSYDNAKTLKLPDEQTQELAEMYVSYHSFDSIQNDTKRSYQTLIASHQDAIRLEADDLWMSCRDMSHNDEETPSGRYFQVSDGYLVSSFYNCLNAQIPERVKQVVRSIEVKGSSVTHPKEEMMLTDEILPQFVAFLKDSYNTEREKEISAAFDYMANDKGSLRRQVLSNFSWVKNIADSTQIVNDCKQESYRVMSFSPLYNLKKDLFGKFLESNVCFNISATREFNQWVDSSKDDLSTAFLNSLEDKIHSRAVVKAKSCLGAFPVDTALNKIKYKKQREACLMNDWPRIEEEVLSSSKNDPVAQKFGIPPEVIKGRIELNRRRIQIRIFKEYFN